MDSVATSTALPFKVADLALAEAGRHQLRLAENEMPGLMALRAEFGAAQPLVSTTVTSFDGALVPSAFTATTRT